jgi:hypothetical protein
MWYEGTVGDVTDEQANVVPPGVTHPIGALMAHVLQCEDVMINQIILGKAPVWEQGGWKEKVGGELMLDLDEETGRAYRCKTSAMSAYGKAVFASTDAFLAALSDDELNRELELVPLGFPSNMTVGRQHVCAHRRDIVREGLFGQQRVPLLAKASVDEAIRPTLRHRAVARFL